MVHYLKINKQNQQTIKLGIHTQSCLSFPSTPTLNLLPFNLLSCSQRVQEHQTPWVRTTWYTHLWKGMQYSKNSVPCTPLLHTLWPKNATVLYFQIINLFVMAQWWRSTNVRTSRFWFAHINLESNPCAVHSSMLNLHGEQCKSRSDVHHWAGSSPPIYFDWLSGGLHSFPSQDQPFTSWSQTQTIHELVWLCTFPINISLNLGGDTIDMGNHG